MSKCAEKERGPRWSGAEEEYSKPAYKALGLTLAPAEYMPKHLIGLRGPKGMILLNTITGKISFFEWPLGFVLAPITPKDSHAN